MADESGSERESGPGGPGDAERSSDTIWLTDFGSVVRGPSAGATWVPAGFPTEEGGVWHYQEPEAVVVVQDGALRVGAVPFTRQHDETQILDNAKHMYFSARSFAPPEGGRLRVEWGMAAQIVRGRPGDLYDAFVSFHLMDLARGCATNFFVGNDRLATVYALIVFSRFSGTGGGFKKFCRGETDISNASRPISPEEIENRVLIPAENVVAGIEGVEYVYSHASPGMALMTVRFEVGAEQFLGLIINSIIEAIPK